MSALEPDTPAPNTPGPREVSLETARESYYEATGKTSEVFRQLCFAGIAVIWILSGASLTKTGGLKIPDTLLWAGFLLVLALAVDLGQYAYRSIVWGWFSRRMEQRNHVVESAPEWINRWAIGLWCTKLIFLAIAYGLIMAEVLGRLG